MIKFFFKTAIGVKYVPYYTKTEKYYISNTASGCIEEGFLINGSNPLPGHYMTASSSYAADHGPEFAILHNQFVIYGEHIGSWCPTSGDHNAGTSYIQVPHFRTYVNLLQR